MLKKINVFTIIICIVLGWFIFTFYSIAEEQERPQFKIEVSRLIRNNFFNRKSAYKKLASYLSNVKSYSTDWYIMKDAQHNLSFFSRTSFDSCKMTPKDYIQKYYHGPDTSIATCYVPDFKIVPDLAALMDTLQLSTLSYYEPSECGRPHITFTYENSLFTPEGRLVQYVYFPKGICKEMMGSIKKSDNKWNWAYYLDTNWVAQSEKKHVN